MSTLYNVCIHLGAIYSELSKQPLDAEVFDLINQSSDLAIADVTKVWRLIEDGVLNEVPKGLDARSEQLEKRFAWLHEQLNEWTDSLVWVRIARAVEVQWGRQLANVALAKNHALIAELGESSKIRRIDVEKVQSYMMANAKKWRANYGVPTAL